MKMSCNGCRVLRKGCSENCALKPCLQWIQSPDSQANATLFLAKFYGRAGLLNLLTSGPHHLHPEIFRSLLYEACGRIINPIHGSVGLMWSGNWQRCQAAVEAVLKGNPIMKLSTDNNAADAHPIMPLHGCDIRHLSKDTNVVRRARTRNRFRRTDLRGKRQVDPIAGLVGESPKFSVTEMDYDDKKSQVIKRASSHDSISVETVEPSLANRSEPLMAVKAEAGPGPSGDGEVFLELTLGLNPVLQPHMSSLIKSL